MSFLLACLTKMGDWLTKLAPLFFAWQSGKYKAEYDFEKSVNEVLREDNEELRQDSVIPDTHVAHFLRERAARKNEIQD